MSRIHFYKKVNFVKNVTYEVLSRQRRYRIVSYRIVEKDIEFFDISRYLKNIAILSLVQSFAGQFSVSLKDDGTTRQSTSQ